MNKLFRKIFPSKEMRAFNKMHRRHRKELIKLAKETNEYDYCWLHESVIMHIKHLHEYYSAGNNVWQVDESRLKIVEQLQRILDLESELEKIDSDDCGIESTFDDDDKITQELEKKTSKLYGEVYHSIGERTQEREKKINKLYEEIYSSIGRNIRYWWD